MPTSLLLLSNSVVLFLVDDISAYEREQGLVDTPVIDSLANQGIEFTRAYANPVCVVTRHSLFLSDWNARDHGSACDPPGPSTLSLEEIGGLTLPRAFPGYSTAHFGKGHMGTSPVSGTWETLFEDLGFGVWLAGTPNNVNQSCMGVGLGYFTWQRIDEDEVTISSEYVTLAQVDAFKTWWQETPGRKFAQVSLQAAHVPHHNPPAQMLPPGSQLSTNEREQFEAMVASADWAIGQMLTVVQADTWVVVMGDNGTTRRATHSSRDRNKQKKTVFEGGVRVTLIVKGPGLAQGVSDQIVHAVDILPTFAWISGISVAADGQNIFNPLSQRDWAYVVNVEGDEAIITERWKLHAYADGSEALYDLWRDPLEECPLDTDRHPVITGKLAARLEQARGE